ncbi:MAG: hypothetical protein ACKO9A_26685, partial [Alphaproteobacteria bacterium]
MSLHGAPMLAQNPITRLRSTTNDTELTAMRAAAWHRHGVKVISGVVVSIGCFAVMRPSLPMCSAR